MAQLVGRQNRRETYFLQILRLKEQQEACFDFFVLLLETILQLMLIIFTLGK
jgi:hypothetical protein